MPPDVYATAQRLIRYHGKQHAMWWAEAHWMSNTHQRPFWNVVYQVLRRASATKLPRLTKAQMNTIRTHAGEIFTAAYFGDMKKLKPLKLNPTPKLKKIRAIADRWIRLYGWRVALNKANRMERDRNFRHGRLLRRVLYRIRDAEAIKPGPQQSPKIIKRKKIVRTTQAMYQRLLDEYGTESPLAVRGFILEDGSCLNLGQYDDHRIINSVYADTNAAETRFGSRYGAFVNLCKKFNMIRWIPESKQVEIFGPTTRHQDTALRDLMDAGKLREVEVWHRGRNVVLEAEDSDTMIQGIEAIYG